MTGTIPFIQDLAVVLLVGGLAALVCHWLDQPKVVGYIVAGLVIGPNTPPFSLVVDEGTIHTLGDLGVVFLMFSLGLEFNLRRMRKAGATAVVTGTMDVVIMVCLGYLLGRQLGWTPVESLFLGAIICDSSTTVLIKTLQDLGRARERFAGSIVGITVFEDMLAVILMAGLTGIAVTGQPDRGAIGKTLAFLTLFLLVVVVAGLLTVPRLVSYLSRLNNEELLLLPVVGICFGVSVVAARLELSMALGAVLVGALASESRAVQRLAGLFDPLRHIFGAVFLVTVGLMLNPAMLLRYWLPIVLVTALVIVGKFVNNTVGTLLTGHDLTSAVQIGAGIAQTAEFAIIIATLGISLGATGEHVYQVGVMAAVLTTLLSPYLLRAADRYAPRLADSPLCRRWAAGFGFYSQWLERAGKRRVNDTIRRAIRRLILLLIVNIALIGTLLGVAGYVVRALPRPWLKSPWWSQAYPVLVWLAAMALALPMYVGCQRKLEAIGAILAELALPISLPGAWARHARAFVTDAIWMAGMFGIALLTFILSAAVLQSEYALGLLMAVIAVATVVLWRRLARLYGRAQVSLHQAWSGKAAATTTTDAARPPLDLKIEEVWVGNTTGEAVRTLGELALRARTGATVVAIERNGVQLDNPGAGTPLQPGDRLFLLGNPDEIEQARGLLASPQPASPEPPATA